MLFDTGFERPTVGELVAAILEGGGSAERAREVENLLSSFLVRHVGMTSNHRFTVGELDAAGVLP